jgi:predicted metal-binding membrane protein
LNFSSSEPPVSVLEYTAKKERWIVLASLALVAVTGLFATLQLGDILMMPSGFVGGAIVYPVLLFIMWWTMMMAMMLPSAAPAILTFGALSRKFAAQGASASPISLFVAGYAAVWTGFAAVVVALQLLVGQQITLSMMMAVTSSVVGGSLLVAAGLYQLSPLKSACLRKCQAPLMFFANNWRRGHLGSLRMGLLHGLYCLGCCWVLMGLLFYGGVMELRWIVGLALYVAAEKLIPAGNRLSQFNGILLIGWGVWVLYWAFV